MLKTAGFVGLGLVAGIVIATWWGDSPHAPSVGVTDEAAPLTARLDALEAALAAEERRRLVLEDALVDLEALVAALPSGLGDDARPPPAGDRVLPQNPESVEDDVPPPLRAELAFGPRARFGRDDDELVERFVAAGISVDRAQWIVRRTEELRMEALQAQYDAAREGTPPDGRALLGASNTLRTELGDADYERYLQALDRPTSVFVRDVLSSSPGAQAGIQPGDQVVAYGGERVFDMSDLNRLVIEGTPGQMVAVEVLREGQPIQLYVPRGPIGITGGGRGMRPR